VHPPFVVDALEVFKVRAEKVIALVHGHDGAHHTLGLSLAAVTAHLVAKRPPSSGVLVTTDHALWVVNVVAHTTSPVSCSCFSSITSNPLTQ
jgi:hypothetical protein